MEVSVLSGNSIRIKSKNTSFTINPDKKVDGDVILLTKKSTDYSMYDDKIVFDGPGEYEVSGVSIKGEKNGDNISFDLLEDRERILVIASTDVEKSKEAEDYVATVVLSDNSVDKEALSKITSGLVIVVGDVSAGENVKKIDKINLKKTEDYKGFLVHLSK